MTLSPYKENKIIKKRTKGKKIKQIAREEKVCPETVRRCLERNSEITGYKRKSACQEQRKSKKESEKSRFRAGDFTPIDTNQSLENKNDENNFMQYSLENNVFDGKKRIVNSDNQDSNSEVDQICSILEKMKTQEDRIVNTLADQSMMNTTADSPNTLAIKQLIQEINDINVQLAEVREQITRMQSSEKQQKNNE
jgi:hypothetical protein